MQKTRGKGGDGAEQKEAAKIATAVGLACALLMLLRLLASFFPASRSWGINHLAYFPLSFRISLTFCGLLVCLPSTANLLARIATRIGQRLTILKGRLTKNRIYLLVSISFLLIFWSLKSATYLLGDGQLWVSEMTQGINTMMIRKEHLTLFMVFHLYRLVNHLLGWSVGTTYAVTSCVAGGALVFLLLKFVDSLEVDSLTRRLLVAATLFMGSSQLFFGYVENYTLHYVAVFAYIFSSMQYLGGKGSLAFPSLLFLLCLGLHNQAVFLLPSLAYLWIFAFGQRRRAISRFPRRGNMSWGLLFSLLLLLGVYFAVGGHIGRTFLMPLLRVGSSDDYTLFSLRHLADMVNQHLLISSPGLVLMFSLILVCWKRIKWGRPITAFLLLAALYSLLFNFFVDPLLGMARDWDLFAATGLGYTVLGLFLLGRLVQSKKPLRYIGTTLAGTALVSVMPWLLINSTEGRAVDRFKDLLALDRSRSAYGYENLSIYCRERNLTDERMEALRNAQLVSPDNPRYYGMLGDAYETRGLIDDAIAQYEKAVKIAPSFPELHTNLGNLYTKEGMYEEAEREHKKAIEIQPGLAAAHNNLADVYRLTKRYGLAWEHLRIAQRLGLKVNPRFLEALRKESPEPRK